MKIVALRLALVCLCAASAAAVQCTDSYVEDTNIAAGEMAFTTYTEEVNKQIHVTCLEMGPDGRIAREVVVEHKRAMVGVGVREADGDFAYPIEGQVGWGSFHFQVNAVNGVELGDESQSVTVPTVATCDLSSSEAYYDTTVKVRIPLMLYHEPAQRKLFHAFPDM
jgi:hypothetical protein